MLACIQTPGCNDLITVLQNLWALRVCFVVYHVITCSSYSLWHVSIKLLYICCLNPLITQPATVVAEMIVCCSKALLSF